jgi:hypothetical protein
LRKLPTWLKILIPAMLLLFLMAAAVYVVVMGELPEDAQAAAVEARFGEQLSALRELTETAPLDPCPDGEERSQAEMVAGIRALSAWKRQVKERAELFSDSAILGAELVMFCADGSTKSVGISAVLGKEYEEPTVPLSRALYETPTSWPVVSLWYDQDRRLVRYEDRLREPPESARGFRLILDLEGLEASVPSARERGIPISDPAQPK